MFPYDALPGRTRPLCWLPILIAVLLLAGACSPAANRPTAAPATDPATDSAAGTGCVETFDPTADYFPDKATLTYADGWTIDYFNHYKVITVLNPWQEADETFQYVLVQCGTPTPDGFDGAQVVEIPAESIITMSTTYLPHLAELGLVDRLVGLDNPQFVNTPAVVAQIEAGAVATIGSGAEVNVERVLELAPALVMTYGTGSPENDAHPQLLAAGVPVAINAEYMEATPLGRAEWIKFTAAFFNAEATAGRVFGDIAQQYEALAEQARATDEQPTVLVNAPFQGTWYMPGGQSYPAQFLEDAGTAYLWADDPNSGSLPLSFETVFEQASTADYWLNPGIATTRDELLALDERLGSFAAFEAGRVYNNNKRLNANGGNDYWESGVTRPHLVLADLVAIFHPELLPDHELYYYQQVR